MQQTRKEKMVLGFLLRTDTQMCQQIIKRAEKFVATWDAKLPDERLTDWLESGVKVHMNSRWNALVQARQHYYSQTNNGNADQVQAATQVSAAIINLSKTVEMITQKIDTIDPSIGHSVKALAHNLNMELGRERQKVLGTGL